MTRSSEIASEVGQKSALLADAIEHAPVGVAVFQAGRLVFANRALLALFGESSALEDYAALGTRIAALIDERTFTREGGPARLTLDATSGAISIDAELVIWGPPGHDVRALFARKATTDPANRGDTERWIALGQLAAGVAHDINNPLAYVLGSIELAERALRERLLLGDAHPSDTSLLEAIANAREGTERVRAIVGDLVAFAFSRPVVECRALVDVEAALDSSLSLAWNEVRHRARVVKHFGRVPRVSADPSRLAQVFLNLLVNAAQSINETARADAEIVLTTRVENARVIVEICDKGSSIAEADLRRLFEPFSIGRSGSSGRGLGLSICQRIVTSYGGEIVVESQPGTGTTFRVALPIAGEPELAPNAPLKNAPALAEGSRKKARILVIDDEPLLGQTLKFAFAGRHDVVVAASGRQAIEELANDSEYDLVLCDLMMPDVPGQRVFEAVERSYPALLSRFIFMTGGAFTESAEAFLERHPERRIDKPFTIADIEQLLLKIG